MKPEPNPKPIDLDLDLIYETRLDFDLDFKNNLDLDVFDIRTNRTRCHPYPKFLFQFQSISDISAVIDRLGTFLILLHIPCNPV